MSANLHTEVIKWYNPFGFYS